MGVRTCVGAEVKVGGVGAGDAVALPLVVGGGGRPGLVEVQRPAGGDGQLPLLTSLLSILLLPERPTRRPEFQSFDFSPLVPIVDVLQDCRRDPSKV